MIDSSARVLLIYVGGTIGMVEDTETGALEPFNFSHLESNIPEIKRLNFHVKSYLFDPPIDSSDVSPEKWIAMAKIIKDHYDDYDGFVILHGTDTMAYTASVMSLMFENLTKPIILTGSQLPIGKLRTDGKENLITALEIAADKDEFGKPTVPELCIYMQNVLLRGNRTTKINAQHFSAFSSPNYPPLARTGVDIQYEEKFILKPDYDKPVRFHLALDHHVAILKLFPGITEEVARAFLTTPGLRGVVFEAYGAGNSPQTEWFINLLRETVEKGIVVVNVTQCLYGSVDMHRYKNGQCLEKLGLIGAYDITTEAALAKMMILFGEGKTPDQVKELMPKSLRGELTVR